jgi:hypothetical protein
MLRVDPQQHRRLEEIIRNLEGRIEEARVNGWLGEVQGLQISLKARGANSRHSIDSPEPSTADRPCWPWPRLPALPGKRYLQWSDQIEQRIRRLLAELGH